MNIHLKHYYYNVNSSNSRYLKYNKLLGQNEIESTLIIESRLDLFYLNLILLRCNSFSFYIQEKQ